MDEVIFFRRPSDASHLLLFNLPHPPHPLMVDEDSLSQLCSQHGLLFQCTIHTAKDDPIINASLHPIPSPFCDDAHHTQPDTLTLTHPSTSHPSAPAAAEPAAPQWAHVHYFSVVDARAAMKALREHFRGSNVRAVWSRRREAAAADEEEGSAAGGRASAPRFWPISFAASLQVINHFLGPLHWTCSINWTRRYDPAEHGHILSGQTEESASESELEAFHELQRANAFPCSFACEVEFRTTDRRQGTAACAAPTHTGSDGGLHVACQAVSHTLPGRDGSERENGLKRAVTNAYLALFQHLAIIRTREGNVHVRAFD